MEGRVSSSNTWTDKHPDRCGTDGIPQPIQQAGGYRIRQAVDPISDARLTALLREQGAAELKLQHSLHLNPLITTSNRHSGQFGPQREFS